MIVETISGSYYEIDEANNQIRRLKGNGDITPRFGEDGKWKKYRMILPETIQVGKGMIIAWEQDTPLLPETRVDGDEIAIPATYTSNVKRVYQEGNTKS